MSSNLFVISGCSGAGKSTLLAELSARGHAVFEEPGRQVVKEQLASGGDGLPWVNAGKFTELCIERALAQHTSAEKSQALAFFDRSLVDALNALEVLRLPIPQHFARAVEEVRYAQRVFMTPPWPAIYRTDTERRHSFTEAVQEYERLTKFYARNGYDVVLLPNVAPAARADFALAHLG
jgi:predicted ATPase